MYDVAIYGHLVFDTIFDKGKKVKDFGGIANVWRSFNYIDPKLEVYVCPTDIGTAHITLHKEESERDGHSQLNIHKVDLSIQPAKYNHILYINELDDLEFISRLDGINTADICAGRELDSIVLPFLDYIFVSHEDKHLLPDLSDYNGVVVYHSPKRSYTNTGLEYVAKENEYIKGLNVLGAGDFFASCFIYAHMHERKDVDCLTLSHKLTTRWLKETNEET